MKKLTTARLAAGLSLVALTSVSSFAVTEYTLTAGLTPAQLVDLLVPNLSGINVIGGSETFTGAFGGTIGTSAAGKFEGGLTSNPGPASGTGLTGLAFDEGILLSTGNIRDSRGTPTNPNGSDRISTEWGGAGSSLLETHVPVAAANLTSDAATLSFRFTLDPGQSLIAFQYAFASDEYKEYITKGYSDAFAFILTDETASTSVNLATIPPLGGSPVSVSTINPTTNPLYYTDNDYVNPPAVSPYLLEYDGIAGGVTSLPLLAIGLVNPTHTYRIDLVIADVGHRVEDGDTIFEDGVDSAVFLRANSFIAGNPVPEPSTYVGAVALAGLIASRLRRKKS